MDRCLRRRNLHRRAFGPSIVVNRPTARDFVAFGVEILAPSTQVQAPSGRRSSPSATKSKHTGLRPVVHSNWAYNVENGRWALGPLIVAFGDEIYTDGPTARDFVAFGEEILVPSMQVDGPSARRSSPSATKSAQTGLRSVVRSERAYGP